MHYSQTAGDTFGTFFVFVAPFIGAIGGFLTGSNAGSNAMFIKLQMQTAQNVALRGNMSQPFKTLHHQ